MVGPIQRDLAYLANCTGKFGHEGLLINETSENFLHGINASDGCSPCTFSLLMYIWLASVN